MDAGRFEMVDTRVPVTSERWAARHTNLAHIFAILSLALALVLGGAAQLSAQRAETTRSAPRPDLSGTYDTATLTPLTRPREYGDKLFLSADEARAIEDAARRRSEIRQAASDPNRSAPQVGGAPPVGLGDEERGTSGAGNVGGYNDFYIDRGTNAFEVDGRFRTSIITDPADGQMPPMKPEARQRMAKLLAGFRSDNDGTAWWVNEPTGPYDDPELRGVAERCLLGFGSTQGPPMLPVLYNNHKRIVQTDDAVMILVEMVHDARIIRIGGEHASPDVRRWLGDSVGHWEGDTLVVSTKNFTDSPGLFRATRDLEVIERFSRLDDETLFYEFTVTDPNVWDRSWTGSYTWPETDEKVFEYACHEGNYALGTVLRGARLLEREALDQREGAKGREP